MPGWCKDFAKLAAVVIDRTNKIKSRGQLKLLRVSKDVGGFGYRPADVSEEVVDDFLGFINTHLGNARTMPALRKALKLIIKNNGTLDTSSMSMAAPATASSVQQLETRLAARKTAALATMDARIRANFERMFAENMDHWYHTLQDITMHTELLSLSPRLEAAMLRGVDAVLR